MTETTHICKTEQATTCTLELETIGGSRPWVARITGTDQKYGLAREFVNGTKDYSQANKPRTRGVYTIYTLADGIYEVNSPEAWGKTKRFFVRIAAGERTTISAVEVRKEVASEPAC